MNPNLPRTDQPPPHAVTLPPGYIAALDHNGRLIAIPSAPEPPPAISPATPAALPERAPASLPPIVGQIVVLGSITTLAASGAFWVAAAALRTAHPVMPDAVACLKWAAVFVAVVVAGVFTAKARSRVGGSTTFSLVHTTKTTTVGRQTVRGRNNRINNRF